MTSDELSIRDAGLADSEAIAPLLAQLGYPAAAAEVHGRLKRLLATANVGVLVAELDMRVVALAAFQFVELVYRPRPQCRITALVVDSEHRRRGIAAGLVATIERIAREHGCFRLELTTRQERWEAFSFYSALGFTERPRRLVKPLADEPPRHAHRSERSG